MRVRCPQASFCGRKQIGCGGRSFRAWERGGRSTSVTTPPGRGGALPGPTETSRIDEPEAGCQRVMNACDLSCLSAARVDCSALGFSALDEAVERVAEVAPPPRD